MSVILKLQNLIQSAIYSKPLMVPYTNENKQYGPFTSSGSKPITNQDLAEILTLSQKGPLPEWKLSSFDGNPLQWPELFGQFKSAIDAKILSDDVKLTYLKTLVSGKVENAIAEFAYSGVFYKDALKTLERRLWQLILKNFRIFHLSKCTIQTKCTIQKALSV